MNNTKQKARDNGLAYVTMTEDYVSVAATKCDVAERVSGTCDQVLASKRLADSVTGKASLISYLSAAHTLSDMIDNRLSKIEEEALALCGTRPRVITETFHEDDNIRKDLALVLTDLTGCLLDLRNIHMKLLEA